MDTWSRFPQASASVWVPAIHISQGNLYYQTYFFTPKRKWIFHTCLVFIIFISAYKKKDIFSWKAVQWCNLGLLGVWWGQAADPHLSIWHSQVDRPDYWVPHSRAYISIYLPLVGDEFLSPVPCGAGALWGQTSGPHPSVWHSQPGRPHTLGGGPQLTSPGQSSLNLVANTRRVHQRCDVISGLLGPWGLTPPPRFQKLFCLQTVLIQ